VVELPAWDSSFPNPVALRNESDAMLASIVDELRENLGDELLGVYAHGSSTKAWDSPVDYVPELSDVDVHVLLRDPALLGADLERTLQVQAGYERRFAERISTPLHYPRPQVIVINESLEDPGWFSPPPGMTKTLFGRRGDLVRPQPGPGDVFRADLANLTAPALPAYIASLPAHVIDRPARYLWQVLRDLSWRVGPVGPRVLTLAGADYHHAWGGNRTNVLQRLEEARERELAEAYSAFYVHGWRYFLSTHTDSTAARDALRAAVRVLEIGIERGTGAALAT
jgi:hypothetical protein